MHTLRDAGVPADTVPAGVADDEFAAMRVRAANALNVSRPVCAVAEQILALPTIDEPWMLDILQEAGILAVLLYTATLGAGLPAVTVSTTLDRLLADSPPSTLPLLLMCATAVEPTRTLLGRVGSTTADQLITRSVRALLALRSGRMDVAMRLALRACERASELHETSELSWAALQAVAIAIDEPELSGRVLAVSPEHPAEQGCLLLWANRALLGAVVTAPQEARLALGRIDESARRLDQAGWRNPVLFPWRSWAAPGERPRPWRAPSGCTAPCSVAARAYRFDPSLLLLLRCR